MAGQWTLTPLIGVRIPAPEFIVFSSLSYLDTRCLSILNIPEQNWYSEARRAQDNPAPEFVLFYMVKMLKYTLKSLYSFWIVGIFYQKVIHNIYLTSLYPIGYNTLYDTC